MIQLLQIDLSSFWPGLNANLLSTCNSNFSLGFSSMYAYNQEYKWSLVLWNGDCWRCITDGVVYCSEEKNAAKAGKSYYYRRNWSLLYLLKCAMNSCFAMCFISSSKAGKSYCNATQGPAWIHEGIGTRPNDAKLEHARVTKIVCIVNWIKIQLIYSKYIHGSKKEVRSRIMRWWVSK